MCLPERKIEQLEGIRLTMREVCAMAKYSGQIAQTIDKSTAVWYGAAGAAPRGRDG